MLQRIKCLGRTRLEKAQQRRIAQAVTKSTSRMMEGRKGEIEDVRTPYEEA